MVKKSKKRLVYIKPLSNYVEVNVLDAVVLEKYKHTPQVLLALGVTDFYNLIHRTLQKAIIDKVTENNAGEYTASILSSVLGQILTTSIYANAYTIDDHGLVVHRDDLQKEKAELKFGCDASDEKFLKECKIDPRSLV